MEETQQHHRRAALRAAVPATIPVMTGFLCLGIAYGVLMQSKGYGPGWSVLMSAIAFGGSMQFVAITLLTTAFDPIQAFLLSIMVNARHMFYGLSLLDKYKGLGKVRPFLIYVLCDETFSLVSTLEPPEGVAGKDFYFWISLLDYLYWITGTALGGLAGNLITFDTTGLDFALTALFVVLFLVVIWVIVFMNEAERRIPVQYAKKVVGRKMYGGQSTFLPVKVAMSGVMPVIFASAILSIPQFIQFFWNPSEGFGRALLDAFSSSGWLYVVLYFFLILMFAYFYMSIQYNPLEMANNLRQNNGTIPGIRPGKPTADFIAKILSKVTLIGALFLAFVALVPIIYTNVTGMYGLSMGGTSIIIIVGVALETVKQLESQMMLRHYKGFLD